jgi:superfamily II DNA or RNA helicase
MSDVQLTEKYFLEIAGWEAMKQGRAYLSAEKVLSSNWTPPILKGVVQAGEISFRSGLVIKGDDVENMCTCRQSQDWGTICAHSIAVGLHYLQKTDPKLAPAPKAAASASPPVKASTRKLQRAEHGVPVEIAVILPPNLGPALAKGKVMLCFEGLWQGKRGPLNSLPMFEPYRFAPQDLALLDEVERIAEGDTPGMMQVDSAQFAAVLLRLVEHPRVTFGRSSAARVSKTPFRLNVQANLEPNGEMVLKLKSSGQAVPQLIVGERETWILQGQELQSIALPRDFVPIFQQPVRLPRSRIPQFLSQDWPRLSASCDVQANFKLEDFVLEPQEPKFHLMLLGGIAQLQAQLQCAYGPRIMTVGVTSKDESLWLPDEQNVKRYSTRDVASEQKALGRLLRSGFTGPDTHGRYQLLGQNQVLNFFAREYSRMEKEWNVTLDERLQHSTEKNLERVEPQFQISSSGIQWFDLNVNFATQGGERFSAADIQRLVLSGQSHTRLKNGKFAIIDTGAVEELQEVLLDCSPEQKGGVYRMSQAQAGFLDSTLRQNGWKAQAPSDWKAKAQHQSGETKLACPPLGDLEKVLRPYQKHGVAWLHFLRQNNFGGILADEMGLGKTLQALTFLETIQKEGGGKGLPTLVVCPTSLVFNWLNEALKFTPTLKAISLHGPNRHPLFARIPECDLVVTSYALIRRDAEKYREFEFDTVILDEAQHIKNRQTQNAQAVKAIRSQYRVVLTGTPMENSVLDLWSIFDFLMPGYLGSAQDFRERYELPITREKDVESQARLARRLRPFILRRLKQDVAKDLPSKIEQVSFCELTDDQRTVYQQILDLSRKEVMEAVGAQGLAKSRMVVLTALLRLRQICCDLRLLKMEEKNGAEESNQKKLATSGKVEMFGELLEEIIDGGHRVLIFSQFTSMLALLRDRLKEEEIDYCYLDGSTINRGEVVDRFQKNTSIPAFLISLKAGGVGLNLTGADTVIHFDPWWNPAVEDQATDRAHRIGQTKVVTSYKLITRETVEEKILNLQIRKREVIKATLSGEEQLTEALTWEDIQELFA